MNFLINTNKSSEIKADSLILPVFEDGILREPTKTINSKNNKQFSKILKSKRWAGITGRKGPIYDVSNLGWNYYMNEFSAAIGIEQLKKLNKTNSRRKEIAKIYSKELKIEEREPKEIWDTKIKNLTIKNPAFELIPNKNIKKIVCELGVLSPKKFIKKTQKAYPWIK